jgi:hypothetical protein
MGKVKSLTFEGEGYMLISVQGVYRSKRRQSRPQFRCVSLVNAMRSQIYPAQLKERHDDACLVAYISRLLHQFYPAIADWDSPEMSPYDHYDAVKASL